MDNQPKLVRAIKRVRAKMGLFGERLRKAREMVGISQNDLGARVGLSGQQIYRYENEQNEPNLSSAIVIAKELNTSLDYLVGLTDSANLKNPVDLSEAERKLIGALRRNDVREFLAVYGEELFKLQQADSGTASNPVEPARN